MDLELIISKLLIAVSMGALMGIERDFNLKEYKKEENGASRIGRAKSASSKFTFIKNAVPAEGLGGVRTYVLIAILGSFVGLAFSAQLEIMLWIVTVGVLLFVHISYFLNYFDKNSFGLSTELSIIINYVSSVMLFATDIPVKLIVAVTVVAILVLSMKHQIHNITGKFTKKEISDSLKFILFTIVLLPFLPDRNYGLSSIPIAGEYLEKLLGKELVSLTMIINPRDLWVVVVFIMSLSFVGYFLSRVWGNRGLNLLASLGGLISSTAVTESLALQSSHEVKEEIKEKLVTAAVIANSTSFLRILLIISILNGALAGQILLPIFLMAAYLLCWFLFLGSSDGDSDSKQTHNVLNIESPFSFMPALGFALLFTAVNLVSKIVLYYLGTTGFVLSSIVASISGLDAVSITTSTIVGDQLTLHLGVVTIVVSLIVNLLVKCVLVIISADRYFRNRLLSLFFIDIILGLIGLLVVLI